MPRTKSKEDELTIDELATAVGMTSRNIRAYQARGLMPPPKVRGRTGYYARDHVARLRLIQDLQADGFSLRGIKRLLEGWNGSSDEVLTFKRAVLAPFSEEEPEFVEARELAERFDEPDPKLVRKAESIGLVRYVGEGRYEVPSPRLLHVGEDLVSLGIPMSHVLAVAEQALRHAQAISDNFLRLFIRDVLDALQTPQGGRDWKAAREAVDRLRPLARDAVIAAFDQAMTAATEREFSRMIES